MLEAKEEFIFVDVLVTLFREGPMLSGRLMDEWKHDGSRRRCTRQRSMASLEHSYGPKERIPFSQLRSRRLDMDPNERQNLDLNHEGQNHKLDHNH